MKRKLLIMLIAIACIFCLAFAFAACDNDIHDVPNTGNVGDNNGNTDGTPDDGGDKHTHTMGTWFMIIKPTCTEEGTIERRCEECDYSETDTIRAIGHRIIIDPAVPSTCQFYGRTEGSHCGICGEVFVE